MLYFYPSALQGRVPSVTVFSMARILVVDDDRQIVKTTGRLMAHLGHAVETVVSPGAFTATFVRFRPDIVLLDLRMPGDGEAILQSLAELDFEGRVVLTSGDVIYCETASLATTSSAMTVVILPKPFDLASLERALT